MTLWDKGRQPDESVLAFSAGEEYRLDHRLVPYDCDASIAHAEMLSTVGLLEPGERDALVQGLRQIRQLHSEGRFEIAREQEDCHTAIEEWLTAHVGPAGKKIHVGRSRNDQVLTALRLYQKAALGDTRRLLEVLRGALESAAARFGPLKMPGYTHMQRAMPTTAGVWLGAFVEAVDDDLRLLDGAAALIDQCPLGTGAGYGIPVFRLDREATASALGFARVQHNPIYAQMSRGKFEGTIMNCLSQIAMVLNRLASDLLLFTTSEFGFVTLPESLCTGSSIMPQKRNPDILELVRAHYHSIVADECRIKTTIGNLMSGYQRDLGLTKEPLFRALDAAADCLRMMARTVSEMTVNPDACSAAMTPEIYATEEAYRLVQQGTPFREAYRRVGRKYNR
ncbi:MAG: argininosuccinate lyase [Acidobacteria bacterium]|nr:argininosuccinate lyase [Acidobacteriota bacterium]